jgi:hypothetical protein
LSGDPILSGILSCSLALVDGAFLATGLAGGYEGALPAFEFDLGPLLPQPPLFLSSWAGGLAYGGIPLAFSLEFPMSALGGLTGNYGAA